MELPPYVLTQSQAATVHLTGSETVICPKLVMLAMQVQRFEPSGNQQIRLFMVLYAAAHNTIWNLVETCL